MDGDQRAKTMDRGASAATKATDLTEGIHEDVTADLNRGPSAPDHAGEKTTGTGGPSVFDSTGGIGKQFTSKGAIGGTAEKIGGPLSSSGAIGSAFTDKGAIGGSVQNALGNQKK